jgi:RNA polymerase sigma-70 factor (ECF subfamily)
MLEWSDLRLTGSIVQDDEQAFEQIFTGYYDSLYVYACSILKDNDWAGEAVQSVFCRIWERRAQLRVQTSLRAYLYGSVYHECVSWLRQERQRKIHRSHVLHGNGQGGVDHAAGKTQLGQLEQRLQQALDELPDQCRAIFQLSRFGELKYREIAEQLGLSVKTVEAQMSKALKLLREKLADFLV